MKDKVLKVINGNSVPKHFCEYGEGIFADTNAVDSMAEEIVKLFSIPIVVQQSEQFVCDHKVREPNGLVYSFRNVCELCGEDMKAK